MAEDPLRQWESLFQRAVQLIDASANFPGGWSLGGGTVLMLRHQHRASKDIDIFVPDPQCLGYLSPKLNDFAARMTGDYVEGHLYLKLRFPEGEIDFIASEPLTAKPTVTEEILGHSVEVETSTEIIAKKVWHRGQYFKARDIIDFALVAEKEPSALYEIAPVLRDCRKKILDRIAANERELHADFDQLEILNYRRTYDECVHLVRRALDEADMRSS